MSAFALTPSSSKLLVTSSSDHVDNGVRDASFPSNLFQNRNSATKVCHSTDEYSSSPITHTHQLNKQKMILASRSRSMKNEEIGVFEAVKYFKGELDGKQKHMNSNKLARYPHDANIDYSHTHDLKRGKMPLPGFSCSCRKKSSDVDERAIEKSSSRNRGKMVDMRALDFGEVMGKKPPSKIGQQAPPPGSTTPVHCRSEETVPPKGIKQAKILDLPIFNPSTRKLRANGTVLQNKENPRFSIEVFGSSPMGKMGMDPSQHRRLLMSCRDFGSKSGDQNQLGTTCRDANADDEVASDSSSDLFEIHSLSRQQSTMNQKPNTDQI